MLPVLVSLGPVKIYTMGVFLLLSLVAGLYYWWKSGRDEHYEEIELFDLFFLSLFAFFVVGRTGYIAAHFGDLGTFYRYLAFLRYPGISYTAGILGAIGSAVIYSRSRGWETWKILDILAVTLSIMLTIGSIGAFLNGSNPGREMGLGVVFPGVEGRRFPVDLLGVVIFGVSWLITSIVRKNFRFYSWYKGESSVAKDGLTALTWAILMSLYFVLRGLFDEKLVHWGSVPVMSLIGLVGIVVFVAAVLGRMGGDARRKLFVKMRLPGVRRKK